MRTQWKKTRAALTAVTTAARSAIGAQRSDRSRTRRRIVALGVGAGVVAASGLVMATPSSAANLGTYTVDCANTVWAGPNSLEASVGDTITVTNNGPVDCVVSTQNLAASGGSRILGARGSVTLTFTSVGVAVALVSSEDQDFGIGFVALVTESPAGPAPVLQQFGMPASGTCDAAAPVSSNWPGTTEGGWSESWAQWINAGNGGAVCTRTLIYSSNQSRWVVG